MSVECGRVLANIGSGVLRVVLVRPAGNVDAHNAGQFANYDAAQSTCSVVLRERQEWQDNGNGLKVYAHCSA